MPSSLTFSRFFSSIITPRRRNDANIKIKKMSFIRMWSEHCATECGRNIFKKKSYDLFTIKFDFKAL